MRANAVTRRDGREYLPGTIAAPHRRMRKTLLLAAMVVMAQLGCGAGAESGGGAGAGDFAAAPSGGGVASGSGGGAVSEAGVLTAGVWDDNLNYDFFTKYLASHPQLAGDPGFTKAEYDASHAEFAQRGPHSVVDAALVIDTTGSMGDEISYLTAEFAHISGAISAAFPGADQRWALVLYRDRPDTDPGDDYIVKTFDFTGDLASFSGTIGAQTASDGGDTPEAPELGLAELPGLSWRNDPSVAKLAFWIGDAPHHDDKGGAMKLVIQDAHMSGIHLYPVSASGTDDLLELTMRSAAEITGGRYLFLTDDSGVGDPHKEPEIPCYVVTKLDKALVRVVSMELAGDYSAANAADVIRTSGDPSSSGTCTMDDGTTVQLF
jgi:hypothetical protein